MNAKVQTIVEVLDLASKSRVSFEQAEQQIRGIWGDSNAKTCALQALSVARQERDSNSGLPAAERLKAARRTGKALMDAASRLKD
jgi:hypothetical protein